MQFHTPPVNQGQIVTTDYGWLTGGLVRRTTDASDKSMTMVFLADPWGECEEGTDEADQLTSWDAHTEPPAFIDEALDCAPEITQAEIDLLLEAIAHPNRPAESTPARDRGGVLTEGKTP